MDQSLQFIEDIISKKTQVKADQLAGLAVLYYEEIKDVPEYLLFNENDKGAKELYNIICDPAQPLVELESPSFCRSMLVTILKNFLFFQKVNQMLPEHLKQAIDGDTSGLPEMHNRILQWVALKNEAEAL